MARSDFEYLAPKELNHDYPTHQVPEVAFLGRSNVGKSSLVNALMRRNLCRTSKSPGRTQQPYYYGLFDKALNAALTTTEQQQQQQQHRNPAHALGYIIDLPGYGFGVSRREVVEGWQAQTQELLLDRRDLGVLKRLFLLIDARREGPTELDSTIMKWLEDAEIPYSVVLTKSDRISVPLVVKQVNQLCLRYYANQQQAAAAQQMMEDDEDEDDGQHDESSSSFVAQSPIIHVTSSTRNWGIHELMLSVETEFVGDDDDDY
jgi:GTP-binding protein EngB required for normal cell division